MGGKLMISNLKTKQMRLVRSDEGYAKIETILSVNEQNPVQKDFMV
ncbi:hypothetical protein ERJ70_06620 [Sediminibacillus dalangtanensis]|uniref:Uncharacterized protein n=1 Tax=Sediminibacillus dalangtanensis TaxID=2729421 RepID=A0ABX7VTS9_9BACI|nr:hypothetical protein [Sediminibacillus dalangtanensis]QTM99005.1 hypothetical protein ERJ70_06620 [Sediminibacillus dalangtanensis]